MVRFAGGSERIFFTLYMSMVKRFESPQLRTMPPTLPRKLHSGMKILSKADGNAHTDIFFFVPGVNFNTSCFLRDNVWDMMIPWSFFGFKYYLTVMTGVSLTSLIVNVSSHDVPTFRKCSIVFPSCDNALLFMLQV